MLPHARIFHRTEHVLLLYSILHIEYDQGLSAMGRLFIGTSGFNYKDWRYIFYPKGLSERKWLSFYAQHYDTVEINATFYRYFDRTVFARWRDETPDSFCFTLKAPKDITHRKRLENTADELAKFVDSIQDLQSKLALILWQFPYSFKCTDEVRERLAQFLQQLPRNMQHVVEFRHTSWFNNEIYSLLNSTHTGFVINDSSRFPAAEAITGDVVYIRFHGPQQLYASSYSTEQLTVWASKIVGWLTHYDVYCYFNNDFGGRAIHNSVELRQLVQNLYAPR
jgi:uncharacterized protein YecE (DUF72 family)